MLMIGNKKINDILIILIFRLNTTVILVATKINKIYARFFWNFDDRIEKKPHKIFFWNKNLKKYKSKHMRWVTPAPSVQMLEIKN